MGLFIKKAVRSSLDKGKVTTSYVVTAICAVLVALNIAAFLFFPRIASPIAIVMSNAITILLMLFAIQPINNLIQSEYGKKARALAEKEKAEQDLRDRVVTLESRNHELESRRPTPPPTSASASWWRR